MKKLTLSEWEKRYIVGNIQRFDQRNTITRRVHTDPEIKQMFKGVGKAGGDRPSDKPGFTQMDFAMRWANRALVGMLTAYNTTRPNASPTARTIVEAATIPGGGLAYKPPEGVKIDVRDPQSLTLQVKKVAVHFGADLVGICEFDKRWVYSHSYQLQGSDRGKYKALEIPAEFRSAIVMGFGEDYELGRHFITYLSNTAPDAAAAMMAFTCAGLTKFIQNLGFQAIDCSRDEVALFTPLAMQAGLGQLGRHGLLITPRFGPRLKLGVIFTDLPLVPDSPVDFGVTEFCERCKKCANNCPSKSILHEKRTPKPRNISNAAGELKWPVNYETCKKYVTSIGHNCDTCVSVCPYNKPNTLFHRTVKWFTDHVRWGDLLYIWADDLFGYGKPLRPDSFWHEWKPNRRF